MADSTKTFNAARRDSKTLPPMLNQRETMFPMVITRLLRANDTMEPVDTRGTRRGTGDRYNTQTIATLLTQRMVSRLQQTSDQQLSSAAIDVVEKDRERLSGHRRSDGSSLHLFNVYVAEDVSYLGGSDIGIQEKKAKLFNEWERFTSTDGESIESYYHRFSK
ncbi:hypothetical protein Tco_0774604 [Tanacetum coccineum]|uniref:Uncharacterized protein n=1 Tax=Tanacetum coccineum TaxID=301880 RepID=A0ABQ4ZHN8_9ASTR